MAFHFRKDEPLPDGLRRIARERIDKAIEALQVADESVEGIHDARKKFKEIRALLRLARGLLGASYDCEKAWYRDARRSLSAPRESQVALTTWEALLRRFPELETTPAGAQIRHRLEARLEAMGENAVRQAAEARQHLLESLPVARGRIADWPLESAAFEDLAGGMRRTYRQGRRGMRKAHGSDDDALWHEWRKRAQDLWYQTRLLRPVWPDHMRDREKRLKGLSGLLGDDHDLVVFRALLGREPELFGHPAFRAQLDERIATRQHQLRTRAYSEGHGLWEDKPKDYARRIEARWKAWSADENCEV